MIKSRGGRLSFSFSFRVDAMPCVDPRVSHRARGNGSGRARRTLWATKGTVNVSLAARLSGDLAAPERPALWSPQRDRHVARIGRRIPTAPAATQGLPRPACRDWHYVPTVRESPRSRHCKTWVAMRSCSTPTCPQPSRWRGASSCNWRPCCPPVAPDLAASLHPHGGPRTRLRHDLDVRDDR